MKLPDKVSIFHMTLLVITAVGLKNHVIVIPPLLQTAGRDAWMAVLLMTFLALIWAFLLIYIYKDMRGQSINTWLEKHIGNKLTRVLLLFIGIYLVIMLSVTLKETVAWTNISYLIRTPEIILSIIFIIPCFIAAMTSLRTIAVANYYLLGLVIIFGFFVATVNIQFKDYSLLLPLFENGYAPIFKAAIYQGSGLFELVLLLLFQHKFHNELRYRHLVINILILTGLTLGPLVGAITEFGPEEATSQRFPAYDQWALLSIGKFVEHVDYLSIYQWLSGAFIRISLFFYMIRMLLDQKSTKINAWTLLFVTFVSTVLVMLPIDDQLFFRILIHYLLPTTFWFFLSLSLLFGVLVFWKRRKKGAAHHEEGGQRDANPTK